MSLQLAFTSPQGYAINNFNLFLEFHSMLTVSLAWLPNLLRLLSFAFTGFFFAIWSFFTKLARTLIHSNIFFVPITDISLPQKQCRLQIPAALLLQQFQIPADFTGGEINLDTKLVLVQRTGFHCPFFLRHIQTHFHHNILNENSTNIRDYELPTIRRTLQINPAYLTNDQAPIVYWHRKPSTDIIINVHITIDEQMSRYNMSYWQQHGQIWIHYLALFLVCAWAMDKLKSYMFSRQLIRAWEIIPWKKIYWYEQIKHILMVHSARSFTALARSATGLQQLRRRSVDYLR